MSLPKSFPLAAALGKTIDLPSPGFGTWAAGDNTWAKDSILAALKAGYRHLDCAWMYGVDGAIGDAIRESGIPREEIFITTKFWPHFGNPRDVELCLDLCLKGMGLDYVDCYLSHWPVVWKPISREALEKSKTGHNATSEEKGIVYDSNGVPDIDFSLSPANVAAQKGLEGSFVPTWKAMQELVKSGKTRTIGLSNFSIPQIEELLPHAKEIPISCNQIEVHPWLPQTPLIEFGRKHGIVTTCWSPFAGQAKDGATLIKDPTVLEVAEKNDMDVGQVLQSWAVQRGTVPLGKSQTESRIKSNLDVRKLSDEDMEALDGLAKPGEEGRTTDPSGGWGMDFFK